MSKTVVMTLRLPPEVARGVERLANRFGHKPAQLGVRLVEEGLQRRDHPHIDLRETAAGRVAYIGGTRFAVYWTAQAVEKGMTPEEFAGDYQLPVERVRAALAYASAFPAEMQVDLDQAETNRKWLERQEASWRCGKLNSPRHQKGTRKAAR